MKYLCHHDANQSNFSQPLKQNKLMASFLSCNYCLVSLNSQCWICKLCLFSCFKHWKNTIKCIHPSRSHSLNVSHIQCQLFLLLFLNFLIQIVIQIIRCYLRVPLSCSMALSFRSIYLNAALFFLNLRQLLTNLVIQEGQVS